jgi:hypothetical protein
MPILLPLIASIALATPALAQVQKKSNYEAGQDFLMEMVDSINDQSVYPRDITAIDVQWSLEDKNGPPIPCKRTRIRGNFDFAYGSLLKCGSVTIDQDFITWKLTDRTGAKFVLSAKADWSLGTKGMAVRIRLDGGWGDSLYLVGVRKPAKAIPAPVIR